MLLLFVVVIIKIIIMRFLLFKINKFDDYPSQAKCASGPFRDSPILSRALTSAGASFAGAFAKRERYR